MKERSFKRYFTRENRIKNKPTVTGESSTKTGNPYGRMHVTEPVRATIPVQNGARLSWDRSIVKFRSGDLVLSDCKGKGPLTLFPQTLSATMKKVMPERNIHLVNSPDINCRSSE